MIGIRKRWLAQFGWDEIVALNRKQCEARTLEPGAAVQRFDEARKMWESSAGKDMSLDEALELCRRCEALAPFVFNNTNTFAEVARTALEDGLQYLPAVEATIIRTTVSHYVAGKVPRVEVVDVLRHFEKLWMRGPAPEPAPKEKAPPRATSPSASPAPHLEPPHPAV